ncbi:peptide transporter [Mycobacterium sp. SWH-M5]|nr:peptide transporter [Mycobacterium sp. SWH-M5]
MAKQSTAAKNNPKPKTRVVTIINRKGGVGKSTIAVNTAATSAELLKSRLSPDAKSPVAAVSIDPQGSAVWWSERVEDLPFHIVQAHDDIAGLRTLGSLPGIEKVYADTPGWIDLDDDSDTDPLGEGASSEALNAVLDVTDLAIVPILTEPLCYQPTAQTIHRVLEPRGIPYMVVVNNWDPRDGERDRDDTIEFVQRNGWPLANTVVRRYKLHTRASAEGQVVTEYPKNRTALEARLDFSNLAHEIDLAGGR